MHKKAKYIILFLHYLCVSCGDSSTLRTMIMDFSKIEITIPNDMTMIQNGRIVPTNIKEDLPIFITYIDSLSCSSCQAAHLRDFVDLFRKAEENGKFQFLLIFSPAEYMMDEIQDILLSSRFEYPVFLDTYFSFAQVNKIPKHPFFKSFLIDMNRHPIFVGDPFDNDRLMSLFNKILLTL